jgi:GT2 family glycosyltransferase
MDDIARDGRGRPMSRSRERLRAGAARRLPPGSAGRRWAQAALVAYRSSRTAVGETKAAVAVARASGQAGDPGYADFLGRRAVTPAELEAQRARRPRPDDPRLWALVEDGVGSARTLRSLERQTWAPARTAVVGSDASSTVTDVLAEAAGAGAHVVLLRAGDELTPDCLYRVGVALARDPALDLVSFDDDLLVDGRRASPRFRAAFSPDMLIGAPYLDRSFAIRASLVAGSLAALDDRSIWAALLAAGLLARRCHHVPAVLRTTGRRHDVLAEADAAVVQAHLGDEGRAGCHGDVVRVRWTPAQWPRVSVVIPTRHNRTHLERLLPSLARTDYPDFTVRIVDNGGRTEEREEWYRRAGAALRLQVTWWTEPFNYSRVNNVGARAEDGEVLVFLNDDTEVLDPGWLAELVGWALRPEVGTVGVQMTDAAGLIQHGGVIVGMGGYADHLFQGMVPGSSSLLGPTRWYRDLLAVTAACVAVRRDVFDEIGGFDERFELTGSDVVLGLDAHIAGLRTVCVPFALVSHLESATRGTTVPRADYFASYWRYAPWLGAGDPFFSPNLSLNSREPRLAVPGERTPMDVVSAVLGRTFSAYRSSASDEEAALLADVCRADASDVARVEALHQTHAAPFDVQSVNWFIPDIDSPFYGGINTAFRIADHLTRHHGVRNRFVVWGAPAEEFVRSALAAAFPRLADAEIVFHDGTEEALAALPAADVGIATLWITAYQLLHAAGLRRKFYLVQDYEPSFYPAGTLYGLAEETYRLGLYSLCNTDNLRRVVEEEYGGRGRSFQPAVDGRVFHADGRHEPRPEDPVTVFVYARPGHWRNCWELTSTALRELKRRRGAGVRIVTAGSRYTAADEDMTHLGLLDWRETGRLYRTCDVGLAVQLSRHPSYLPLELMACGVPVVAADNRWGHWILHDGQNSALAMRTVDSLVETLEGLVDDAELRRRLSAGALDTIAAHHADWDEALSGVYGYLCDPEGTA